MIDPAADTESTLRFYGILKTTAQIATYIGIGATAALSVFDLFYKQKTDEVDERGRYGLNRAGKARLTAFLVISLLTIASTITKDAASSKLDSMSRQRAQAEIRDALGQELLDFSKTTVQPSLEDMNQSLTKASARFDSSVDHAVTSFNSSLVKSQADIVRNQLEGALDAETSNMPLASYSLKIQMPNDHDDFRYSGPRPHNVDAWLAIAHTECNFIDYDISIPNISPGCRRLIDSVSFLGSIWPFIQRIDPNESHRIEFVAVLRSFEVHIRIFPTCGPEVESSLSDKIPGTCIRMFDESSEVNGDTRFIRALGRGPLVPASLEFNESGHRASADDQQGEPLKGLYGRDADVIGFKICKSSGDHFDEARLPKTLNVREYLDFGSGTTVARTYQLQFKKIADDFSNNLYGYPLVIVAFYARV